MDSVIRNKKDLFVTDNSIIKKLKIKAKQSDRKRSRICTHTDNNESVNEMIIALMSDSYVGPHTHPKIKSESYLIIDGFMDVYIFDKIGEVIDKIEMGPHNSGKNFYYRMKRGYWHMPYVPKGWCIYFETFAGPYIDNVSVIRPKWAPNENNKKEVQSFIKDIKKFKK